MMKSTFMIIFGFIVLNQNCVHAVSNGHDIAMTPFKETYVVDINESEGLFENCPTLQMDNPRQILLRNGWTGNDDYAFKTRLFWSSDSIFFRFDIVDDKHITASTTELEKVNGDYFRIDLAHLTCGPDRNSVEPWTILLLPDVENETCNLSLHTKSEIKRTKIGKVESTLFRTIDGYSLIVKLPYEKWDDLPRRGGMTRMQIAYGDSDSPDQIHHRFVLFPIDRGKKTLHTNTSQFGIIRYAKNTWLTTYPRDIVYSQHKATFLMDIGNLTDRPVDVSIYPEKVKSRHSIQNPEEKHRSTYLLSANTVKQKIPIEVNFKGLPSGTYKINGKSGVFYDSDAFEVKYSEKSGLIYCPNLIEKRGKTATRDLNVLKSPDLINKTFQYLAGGGKVLWSAGKYDAASNDFPQYIRKIGKHMINIPQAGKKKIPWALFGGLDNLDGMNEPLILKIHKDLNRQQVGLSPDDPLIQSTQNPPKTLRENFKFLLLLGIVAEYIDEESFPEIHVFTESKTLLKQTIHPTPTEGLAKRHSYIFRIWLTSLDEEVSIENSAPHGSKVEIDFIALLGAAKKPESPSKDSDDSNDSSIQFTGNPLAEIFSKQINTSKFLLKNYLVDTDGKAYSSLPGGRYGGVNLRDWGLLTAELASWGCLNQASALAQKIPLMLKSTNTSLSAGEFTIGHAVMITSIYNTWRKLGKNKSFLDPIWLSCVHQPLLELVKEIETNPLGLVNCGGEFGVYDRQNPATTIPMYFALQAALASGVAMAKENGYGENANRWALAADRLSTGLKRHLVSGESQAQLVSQELFPASWGVDQQQGVILTLPTNAWVYGRYVDENPVLYNDGVRVFDTPYLLSGMSFWSDYKGFTLDTETDEQLEASFDFILAFSPVFRKPAWSKLYMVDYNKSVHQLWTVLAALLLDSTPIASNTLANYIKYTFDEFIPIPKLSDIEVSPYTFEEKLNASDDAENKGAINDDLNILTGTTALKMVRFIAGIDDYDSSMLNLIPRLPDGWKRFDCHNWLISHDPTESRTSKIKYSFERLSEGRYAMTLDSSEKLNAITVRMGPFSAKTRKVRISGKGAPANVQTMRHGFYTWATQTFKKVKTLDITAQEIVY